MGNDLSSSHEHAHLAHVEKFGPAGAANAPGPGPRIGARPKGQGPPMTEKVSRKRALAKSIRPTKVGPTRLTEPPSAPPRPLPSAVFRRPSSYPPEELPGVAAEVLGPGTVLAGHEAGNGAGRIELISPPAPSHAMRLPANWRNVLGRCAWFSTPVAGVNDPRTCVILDGVSATAGAIDAGAITSVVSLPFVTIGGGTPFPVLLPTEVAWHLIPGLDGAYLWAAPGGGYAIQTDAGMRVTSTRDTAALEMFPWSRYLDYIDPTYTTFSIRDINAWIRAFERAPSDVVELTPDRLRVYARESRDFESEWSFSAIDLPAEYDRGAPPRKESIWVSAALLLAALRAVDADGRGGATYLLAMRSARDAVYVVGATTEVAIIAPVDPVMTTAAPSALGPPQKPSRPSSKVRVRHAPTRAIGTGEGEGK